MSSAGFSNDEGRASRKIVAPPGGSSSIVFGNGQQESNTTASVSAPVEASPGADILVVEPARVEDLKADQATVEALRLQLIATVLSCNDVGVLNDALSKLTKVAGTTVLGLVQKQAAEELGITVALQAFKAALKSRGTHGILSIGKRFKSMDDDSSGTLSFEEFKKGLIECGIKLEDSTLHRLFRHFDADCNGVLTYDEFLIGLRGELNERRRDMVNRAYKVLDKTGDGTVTIEDIEGRYDASKHPEVISGFKTTRQVLNEFMEVFEAQGGGVKGDGIVTLEEFSRYYSMISASVDDDDYFELMIRNAWHISGGEGWCANTTCKRVLVVHEDGSQSVVELTDDFDVDVKDPAAVRKKLEEQGVYNVKNAAMYGSMEDSTPAPSSSGPPTPSTAGSRPGTASSTRRGAGPTQMRSSIVFG